jgi:hypothetical protein
MPLSGKQPRNIARVHPGVARDLGIDLPGAGSMPDEDTSERIVIGLWALIPR